LFPPCILPALEHERNLEFSALLWPLDLLSLENGETAIAQILSFGKSFCARFGQGKLKLKLKFPSLGEACELARACATFRVLFLIRIRRP
jgi:hypothetical protein